MLELLLASASPRRREILENFGFKFRVIPAPAIDENKIMKRKDLDPKMIAIALSSAKAEALELKSTQIALTADTIVVIDKKIFGKPKDEAEVRRFLKNLSGKCHEVITGITLRKSMINEPSESSGKLSGIDSRSICEVTHVIFSEMTPDDIDWYIESGEPFGKAGGYAIQGLGGLFIQGIVGCYFNVVGLPVFALIRLMNEFGLDYRDFIVQKKEKN